MEKNKIKIGVHPFSPLVFLENNKWKGFEIELWEKIAAKLGLEYEYTEEKNFQDLLHNVEDGNLDLGMAGVSRMVERREKFDMSFLTLGSGLRILSRKTSKLPLKTLLRNLLHSGLGTITIILFVTAFVVANFYWFIEKGESVAEPYITGIFESFWWAFVTFSTVGYGDIFPTTVVGKGFGVLAILIGLAVFGLFIGNLSSALAVERSQAEIKNLGDLKSKNVGTKEGTSTIKYLSEQGIIVKEFSQIEDAYKALQEKKIDAVVFDGPVLEDSVRKLKGLVLLPDMFARQSYSFITPKVKEGKNELLEKIDEEIIRLHQSGEFDELFDKYFT